jgi:hypothetical protein
VTSPRAIGETDEKTVTVARLTAIHTSFDYEYSHGNSWRHDIATEKAVEASLGDIPVTCLAGGDTCPRENASRKAPPRGTTRLFTRRISAVVLTWIGEE